MSGAPLHDLIHSSDFVLWGYGFGKTRSYHRIATANQGLEAELALYHSGIAITTLK